MNSSTTNPFQASTSKTTSSVESHTIYSVSTVIPCTIFTGHDHAPEACPLLKEFRHLYDKTTSTYRKLTILVGKPTLGSHRTPLLRSFPRRMQVTQFTTYDLYHHTPKTGYQLPPCHTNSTLFMPQNTKAPYSFA